MKSYYQLVRHDGNQELFRTVEMSIIALASGHPFHIHAEGLRGTGKTTIMRAVKEILPPIVRIKNCIYNCHPANPHCPEHRELLPDKIAAIGTEIVPCPFMEISHSAKIGTVVGSIDLGKLTDRVQPTAALLPGTIPQAHRGIIFVDEINRLADTSPELADVLLDVMGTKPGRIQVEETGIPKVELPINVAVWAASNPDEDPGPLVQVRKQLSDRFDLGVSMGRPSAYSDIMAILERRSKQIHIANKHIEIPGSINTVSMDERIKGALASIYVDYGIESLRAIEGMETASGLVALMEGRKLAQMSDLIKVVPLVLGHRTDKANIANILRYLESLNFQPVKSSMISVDNSLVKELSEGNEESQSKQTSYLKQLLIDLYNKLRFKLKNRSSPQEQRQDPKSKNQNSNANKSQGKSASGNNKNANNEANNNNNSASGKGGEKNNGNNNSSQNSQLGQSNFNKQQDAHKVMTSNDAAIVAPPHCAIPLINHSLDNFVASEDKK
ncbi:magnesium chelatase [Dendrosporobacter sp. 1207_IL3150]|uniref:magnesium chelatase n=1 Tax=Dendrosporobacter sp. 1207_IL3150 TaxID=3084054 RepID=UPI002FD9A52D